MKQLRFLLGAMLPISLSGGWSQEITGGPGGDDIPATADFPKLYSAGTDALPYDVTELPSMYPADRLWFDVRDKNLVLREYIREVVSNRHLNLHQWEKSQNYFATQRTTGKLDKDYLRALHARMAFFSKLLQMPYTVASEESHAVASESILWADYNDMVDQESLRLSKGQGISYPGWVSEPNKLDFWESHHPNMNTNLISGPAVQVSSRQAAGYVSQADLPIDPTDFLILAPQNTRNIAHDLSSLQRPVWSLSNSHNPGLVSGNYGPLPQDEVVTQFRPLAYYTNKSYPFIGYTPSTWTPDTWYFTTGWESTKQRLVMDDETQQYIDFWEPSISGILPGSTVGIFDDSGNPVNVSAKILDNMVAFTTLNEEGTPVNLGRGIPDGEVRSYTVIATLRLLVRWSRVGEAEALEVVPAEVRYRVHLVGTEHLNYVVWPNEEQLAYDVKYNPGWGYYNTAYYPWIWRYDTSDWVHMEDDFVRDADNQKTYFYSQKEQAWLYVSSQSAPYAYHLTKGEWITY